MTASRARLGIIVAIVLVVLVAAAAFFVNLYRDSIALEVARSALRGSDVKVSDVRVGSISSNEVRFDAIVLELADGGTLFVEGITLPVRFSGLRGNTLHINSLRFERGEAVAGPVRFVAGLRSFLDAPAAAPGATVRVDEVLLPDLPAVRDLAWHADSLNPTLRATVDSFELFLSTTEEGDGTFRGSLRALLPDDTEALMLGFRLAPDDSGFHVDGDVGLVLEPLLPVLRAAGAVPPEVLGLTATLGGVFEFYLAADETRPVTVAATIDTAAGPKITYRADDTVLELSVSETSPVKATFEYPSLGWTAELGNALVSIGGADLALPPLRLKNSMCRSGIRCTAALDLSYRNLAIGELTVDSVKAVAENVELVSLEDDWRVSSPGTSLTLQNIAVGELAIGKLTAVAETAEFVALGDDWQVSSSDTRITLQNLAIEELTIGKVTAVTEAAEFVAIGDDWRVSSPDTRITPQNIAVAGRGVVAPAIAADLAYSNERVSGSARFTTPDGGLSGQAAFSHDPATAAGKMRLESATLDFATLNLSGIISDWPHPFDITAGRVTAEADVDWSTKDAGFAYDGSARVDADSLAGRYADIGFLGAGTRLDIDVDWAKDPAVKPARFEIGLVDIGVPVENISGIAAPDVGESAVAISSLSMSLLGGTVTADPFRYDLDAEKNELMLRAKGIQLPLMAALADLEAVTVSGGVSGKIPVTIRGNKVIIDGGYLENDPPGGVIRYRGGAADAVVDDGSQLGIVTRTLRNFEFESLTSAVDYSEAGDLLLTMRLKGINPDVDPTQPVILNLNVENNVPQMLRSLRATRSIEDVLEERLSK